MTELFLEDEMENNAVMVLLFLYVIYLFLVWSTFASNALIIGCEAREIIRLVASVRLFVCLRSKF